MFCSTSRRDIAEHIKSSVVRYLAKKVYSCYFEVGLIRRGRLRADILALNMKREFILCEVKSCWADFNTDTKWHKYLDHCNKMYVCITDSLYTKKKSAFATALKGTGVGLMTVSNTGVVKVKINAKRITKEPDNADWMLTKLAWGGGLNRASLRKRRII